ncbi:hypothetical protein J1N35_035118, partial [Gossypium stocksii]
LAKVHDKLALYWAYASRREVSMKRSLQKNFIKLMPAFLDFPKKLQAVVAEGVSEVEPVEIDSAIAKKETQEPDEEIEKIESIGIGTDHQRRKRSKPHTCTTNGQHCSCSTSLY